MERFYIKDNLNLVNNLVLYAITQIGINDSNIKTDEAGEKYVELELRLGERVISIKEFLDRYRRAYDEAVKREALSLLESKLNNLSNLLYQIETETRREAKKVLDIYDEDY